jgi:uncharacterized membrane protein YkoI
MGARPLAAGLGLVLLAAIPAGATDMPPCLSAGETQEVVAGNRVVAPASAVASARRAVPGGDVLRAALCRRAEHLIYRITVLRKDGRLVQVTIDAPSGRVDAVH